ncbi:hypothetical protein B9T62_14260 [Paenibacillus donghaensis]|uniref:ParB/Spo0J HTH domain-containing protein n=2 Tax=Paenibacillus donghaensis TaxID=414771 RepID=A0A2Z2K6L7_9BACL|nr:hypothetical protein B9T62_14260 [Paenibacillus donghaensis]
MAKCAVELERIYRIEHGGDRGNQYEKKEASSNYSNLAKTQEDIANDLGISVSQLHNYKKLLTLIPELQDMVEDKKVKSTVAYNIFCKLKIEEQQDYLIAWVRLDL